MSRKAAQSAHTRRTPIWSLGFPGPFCGPFLAYLRSERPAKTARRWLRSRKSALRDGTWVDWATSKERGRRFSSCSNIVCDSWRRLDRSVRPSPVETFEADHGSAYPQPTSKDRPLRELRGVVERITYQNAENGFTVARLAPERPEAEAEAARGDDRLVTVVGTLADLTPGEAIVAHGWWRNDPKHGWQFQARDYRTALPATLQGMKKYLGSGLVKGIGPVNAGRIVDAFGEATFEVIDDDPKRLTEVPGIGPIRASRIAATWAEQRHIREVMAALQGYGISTSLAVRIYKKFGDRSGKVITEEPYRLAREVWGIGFKTADKIAQAVGIAPDAPERLQAGVLHALGEAADEGHTLLPEAELTARAASLLRWRSSRRRATRCSAALGDAAIRRRGQGGRRGPSRGTGAVRAGRVGPRLAPADALGHAGHDPRRQDLRSNRLARRVRLAGRPPRPDPRSRAGGGRPDGADVARVDPDRRAWHGQDAHAAGGPDAGSGEGAALPARGADRPRGQADGGGDGAALGDAPSRAGAAARRQGRPGRRQPAGRRPGGGG